jgi:hypothetical protein
MGENLRKNKNKKIMIDIKNISGIIAESSQGIALRLSTWEDFF